MGIATAAWTTLETDPQRRKLLAAADRLLAGTPKHSTGKLSVVQLAAEAQVKYWIVAQKHPDLRDHFQRLATEAQQSRAANNENNSPHDKLTADHARLKRHCENLELLIAQYAAALNELAIENQKLREQAAARNGTVTPLTRHRRITNSPT